MKVKFFTNRKKTVLLTICITIFLTALWLCVPGLTAYAAYTGQSGNMSRTDLHSATLAASVSDDTPAITVLMHGLGGDAGDWSNSFNGTKGSGDSFAYDSDSIIEKMRNTSSFEIKLYKAVTFDANSFTLYSEYSDNVVSNITDFSSHTIIIVQTSTWIEMEKIYERLHYVIDKISYDYYIVNGSLPRINLIGHSLGGLLNMQYAIEHPKNVAALVSLGTPYNGSWYDNWLVEQIGITDFQQQPCITGACGHSYYFCNTETRRSTWNSVYSQNTHIKFYALSGETDISLISHIIMTNNYLEEYGKLSAAQATAIRVLYADSLAIKLAGGLLPGDICVDKDSQKAVGYNGVINYNKKFATSNCNVNKRSQDNFPVPHNLETYDNDMHNCILRIIDYGNNTQYNSYTQNDITASIVAKSEGKWLIQITNNTGSARSFEYNRMMCFESDARNWNDLGHVECTDILANGTSTIIEISEYLAATNITISYDSGSTRYIFYASNLDNSSCTMKSNGSTKNYYSYIRNNIKVGIVSKYDGKWLIKLTNNTGSTHSFEYNQNMCFEGDAQNWNGLVHIATTVNLKNGESTIIGIQEYGTATSIAISYTIGSTRYIFYADNLDASGTMSSYGNTTPTYSYTQNGINVGILGKNGSTWQIKLTNNTGSARSFYYNKKMCNSGDAQNWTGLSDIVQTETLANGESTIIEIKENGTATSIAISYINGTMRYIFCANELSTAGTLTSSKNSKTYYSYTQNGMKVSIIGKNDSIWLIELTNNTGDEHSFKYNSKMCFEGDAKNWKSLSDIKSVTLADGATVSTPIKITENGTATSIAISYTKDNYRYVFYAKNLDKSGTMTAMANTIDMTASSEECIAEGTLITLADGSQKAVEELKGDEMLLVWNLQTGTFDSAPILVIDSDPIGHYELIKLSFSDGTTVDIISEHGFWDVNLNKYVYLDENAADYIGHSFMKQDGNEMTAVTLTGVEISTEVTTAYSPVTYGYLCYYVNGMLSMPGGIDGLFNIFEVDGETMTYEEESMTADIAEYGLFTYNDFADLVSEDLFDAVNGQYLKVAIGKGILDWDTLVSMISRYDYLFE